MSDIKDKRYGCFYSGLETDGKYFYDGNFYVGLCSKGFPYCLPADGLKAAYLGNTVPSSAGLVVDESGIVPTSRVFAGSEYIDTSIIASFAVGSYEFTFNTSIIQEQCFLGARQGSSNRRYVSMLSNGKIGMGYASVAHTSNPSVKVFEVDTNYAIRVTWINGAIEILYKDLDAGDTDWILTRSWSSSTSNLQVIPIYIGALDNNLVAESHYTGTMGDVKINDVAYDIAESMDAQLVNSNCVSFDGVSHALSSTSAPTHNGLKFSGKLIWNNKGVTGSIGGKYSSGTNNREFLFYNRQFSSDTTLALFASSDGLSGSTYTFTMQLGWNEMTYEYDEGELTYIINGVAGSQTLAEKSIFLSTKPVGIGSDSDGNLACEVDVACFEYGNAKYRCAEGTGLTLYNEGTVGGDASIIGWTTGVLWDTQDICHANFLNGFDLYAHATLDDLRVSIGSVVTEIGYTYISTNVAGIWHNNAESGIRLPASLKSVVDGDCPNPLYYADFQSFYGLSGFSNTEEFKKKYLVFYDKELITKEIIEVQECIKMKDGVDVWHDSEGVSVYDSNGILATDN